MSSIWIWTFHVKIRAMMSSAKLQASSAFVSLFKKKRKRKNFLPLATKGTFCVLYTTLCARYSSNSTFFFKKRTNKQNNKKSSIHFC